MISTSLLVTIILMVLILAIGVGMWSRHHRARPIVGAIGLMLVPLGLYLLGITELAINGVLSIVAWARRTVWDDIMSWGAGLVGAGILLAVIALFLPKGAKPGQPQKHQSPVSGGVKPQVGARQQPVAKPAARPAGKPAGAPSKDGLTDEDREIEELLRRRGIN
jgi:uncharacterized membrane protein YvlD (DUF360 family)